MQKTPFPSRNPAQRKDCRWEADFSGQIRSWGYQSHGSHWWNGDSPGIWGQKLSVNTTPLLAVYPAAFCARANFPEADLNWDNFRVTLAQNSDKAVPTMSAKGYASGAVRIAFKAHIDAFASMG